MNTTFQIEKNIPYPNSGSGPRTHYPLRQMEIGDSFLVPTGGAGEGAIRSAVSYFAIRNKGYSFSVRKVDEGWRVWRITPPASTPPP